MDDKERDRLADKQTDLFFRGCVKDGLMSEEQYQQTRLGHYSAGTKPEWIELPDELYDELYMRFGLIGIELAVYLNSEAWTQEEIAEHLLLSRGSVRTALEHVYSVLPELRDRAGNSNAIPALRKMCQLREGQDIRHKF
jgi:hypothetical protein